LTAAARSTASTSAVPVFLAFLAMGFGDAVGPFVGLAREEFRLSNFAAQLIPFSGFLMFGVLSVPVGVFQDRQGKKFVLISGLAVMLAGLLIPTLFGLSTFPVFLLTILLLGAGATVLQVSGNPIMRDGSPEGKFARNLSLAQFVKAVGSLSGPLIPVIAARTAGASWTVIFPVYSAALLVAVMLLNVRQSTPGAHAPATIASCLSLLPNRPVAIMVLAVILYVGAEVSVSSSIPLYLKDRFGVDIASAGLLGTGLFFLALTLGRFSGGVILNWVAPAAFLRITCAAAVLSLLGMFVPRPAIVVAGFFLAGLSFANIFPLLFSIVIERMPAQANALAGLMVMAIVGGAVLPPIMGFAADALASIRAAFLVPLAALVYISWAAWRDPSSESL
jgi:FHS family L-fucose permease-like MFS transporter